MQPTRRQFVAAAATVTAAAVAGPVSAQGRLLQIRPPRLRGGDTMALVNPSGAIYERAPYEIATESLQALGFKVREAPHLRARRGHLAGTDAERASDLNAMFTDPGVHGILALTGGSGGNRILPLLDYAAMRRNPKFLGGFSDTTSIITAVQARTGLVTFHCPVGVSEWNAFSVEHWRGAVVDAKVLTLRNPQDKDDNIVPRTGRISTLRGGRAQGPLLGGNLAVLTSMAGSPYWPAFDGAILFLEEINESIYRVDRMLSTLMISGVLDRVAGVVEAPGPDVAAVDSRWASRLTPGPLMRRAIGFGWRNRGSLVAGVATVVLLCAARAAPALITDATADRAFAAEVAGIGENVPYDRRIGVRAYVSGVADTGMVERLEAQIERLPVWGEPSVAFVYAKDAPLAELHAFDIAVVDPDHGFDPRSYRGPDGQYVAQGKSDINGVPATETTIDGKTHKYT